MNWITLAISIAAFLLAAHAQWRISRSSPLVAWEVTAEWNRSFDAVAVSFWNRGSLVADGATLDWTTLGDAFASPGPRHSTVPNDRFVVLLRNVEELGDSVTVRWRTPILRIPRAFAVDVRHVRDLPSQSETPESPSR